MKHYNLYKNTLLIAFAVVLVSFLFSCHSKKEDAPIQAPTIEGEAPMPNTGKEADAQFLVKAAEISIAEIKLGQLAQEKGSSKSIRDLGKMMETEHSKSLAEVTELAKMKMVTIPTAPSFDSEDAYKILSSKSSIAFDKAYADMMVNGHQEAIALFEKTCNESDDSDVRDWATKIVSVLKMHLTHAQMAQKEATK